jgi:methionine sulfoxide reductase heme-binding subunit
MSAAMWYLARGTGVVTLLLLTLTLVLGITSRARRPFLGLARFGVASLHRAVSLFAVVLLSVHVMALLVDPYAQLHLVNLIVPFTSTYRPLWMGLGALSLDLMVVLVVTSLLRDRIGHRTWRAIHWAAYALWPTALLHSLGSGTDSGTTWLRAIALGCLSLVGMALAWRWTFAPAPATARRQTLELTR